MIFLLNTKLYGAEIRHLSVTSAGAECRATVNERLNQCANVYSAPCYLTLRCLNSASHDLALSKKVRFEISFGNNSFVKIVFVNGLSCQNLCGTTTVYYTTCSIYARLGR